MLGDLHSFSLYPNNNKAGALLGHVTNRETEAQVHKLINGKVNSWTEF